MSTRTKITQHRAGWAAALLTTIFAFALLCLGIVLLAQRFDGERASPRPENTREDARARAVRDAAQALRGADDALRTANYGKARAHVDRARAELEMLAGMQSARSGDP